jgi:hypothetical protein
MNDTPESTNPRVAPMTAREKELSERAGARMLIIWFLVLVATIELMVIVHLAK